ncbi:MAG TPA: glycosyltransferase [Acidimicrobiales bacterium]|nr:glycosyltransferase [Acidimicrobiales bacterium]
MISVVMPAHNEQGYLEAAVKTVVTGLRDRGAEFEVIVAENGSVDGSSVEADHLAELYREVEVVHLADADYGRALRAGFLASHGEIVANFDVDFVDLVFLDRALEIMQDDSVAVVVGSKKAPGSLDQRSAGRKLVTTVFTLMLRRGFGLGVSDTHGVKSMRRAALLPVVESCSFGKDIYDTEVVLRAERKGLTIREIPVSVTEVRPARTPIVRRIPRSLLGLARLRIALWRGGGRG